MTKRFAPLRTGACFSLALLLLASCKKEKTSVRKPFKASIETWYRVSPTAPVPVVVNGSNYIGFAHFPGGGSGNATHMGNVTNWFNQLAYTTPPNTNPEGSVGAPVTAVPSYPVLGAPLPLVQAGDFTALPSVLTALSVPTSIGGNVINSIIYNGKGDAVFTSAITGTGSTFPLSEIKVGFNGKALIVGGRGKFVNAVGELDYNGYFNVVDANDAEYHADGWISY
jgi:hypothetical protein